MEAKSIKEMMELIDGLEVVAVAAKKIAKDGKVNLEDLEALKEFGEKFPVILEAVKGISEVPAEAKDINADEAKELVFKLYMMADKLNKA